MKAIFAGLIRIAFAVAVIRHEPALGSVILGLEDSSISLAPDSQFGVNGTILNTGTSQVYLNGDTSSLNSVHLTLDDTDFFVDAPLTLAPLDGSYSGPLFSIDADGSARPGNYLGTFTVRGGTNSNAFSALATASFQITITPEDPSVLLSALGLMISVLTLFTKSRSVTSTSP